MSSTTQVLISGCDGKMGQIVRQLMDERYDLHPTMGFDKYENLDDYDFPICSSLKTLEKVMTEPSNKADIVIDFSSPAATAVVLEFAVEYRIPIVIATTGIDAGLQQKINEASKQIPVFQSANMSYQVNLLKKVLQMVAEALGDQPDIEIIEEHHNRKKDAPSGTAKMFANAINEALGNSIEIVYGRAGKREKNEIGISAIRGGNIVGTHEVKFICNNEELAITHTAFDRALFAEGAIKAAEFLLTAEPGLYSMDDLM